MTDIQSSPVQLSPAAAGQILKTIREQDLGPDVYLAIGVRGFGPKRTFTLDLGGQDPTHDLIFMSHDVRLACRRQDLPQLAGVTVDFQDVGGAKGFVFKIPAIPKSPRSDSVSAIPGEDSPDPQRVRDALRDVIDPEIGINIVDLGLVYEIRVLPRQIHVVMTMTTPACPLSEHIKSEVQRSIAVHFPAVETTEVEIVWEPRWSSDLISPEAKRTLGWSR